MNKKGVPIKGTPFIYVDKPYRKTVGFRIAMLGLRVTFPSWQNEQEHTKRLSTLSSAEEIRGHNT